MAERGQSEVVGFVLVFALIVSMVSLASVAGFSGLQDARDFQRSTNAERAFEALGNGLDDVASEGAPSRQIQMVADDAQVFIGDPVTITVNVSDDPAEFTIHPIVYRGPDGSTLVYSAGAVIRQDADGAIMLREPGFMVSEERSVIRLVQTRNPDGESVGGSRVRVRAEAVDDRVVVAENTTQDVTITIDSARAGVWEQYFASNDDLDCTQAGTELTCEVKSDKVHVTVSEIVVGLS